jgi:hypothetical protein
MIEELDARASAGEPLGRDESGGSGADDDAIGSSDGRVLSSERSAGWRLAPSPRCGERAA